jgi:hypothetical protein
MKTLTKEQEDDFFIWTLILFVAMLAIFGLGVISFALSTMAFRFLGV